MHARVGTQQQTELVSGLAALGFVRFVLATAVALFHIWTAWFPDAGRHAVYGFFVISGFLVCKIANESYNDRPLPFLVNRALRIYPTYWACLFLVALPLMWAFPEALKVPYAGAAWPSSFRAWFNNAVIFTFIPVSGRIINQAWSLEVELFFYFIIGLCTYRSFSLTAWALGLAFVYTTFSSFGMTFHGPYGSTWPMAYMFFAGATAYFISKRYRLRSMTVLYAGALYAFMIFAAPLTLEPTGLNTNQLVVFYFYPAISVAACATMMAALPNVRLPMGRYVAWSDFAGKMSYPIFLLHAFCALPAITLIGADPRSAVFAVTFALLLIISALIVVFVERPIERIRRTFRDGTSIHRDQAGGQRQVLECSSKLVSS